MPARNKKNFRPTKSGAGMTAAGVMLHTEVRIQVVKIKNSCNRKS